MRVIKPISSFLLASVLVSLGVTDGDAGAETSQKNNQRDISKGELSISWSDGNVAKLSNWSLGFVIMEGLDGKDSAEISLSSTSTDLDDRLAFTVPVKGITAETLLRSTTFLIDHKKGLYESVLEVWRGDDHYISTKGEISISNIVGGSVFGTFDGTFVKQGSDQSDQMEISGSFRGKVELVCHALSLEKGLKTSAVNNTDGSTESLASWVLVDADHPFCARYM